MNRWTEIRLYVRFDAEDERTLREVATLVRPRFGAIVDHFYERILEHEGARRTLTEGPAQVERLKVSLHAWLESCFSGPWDEAYFHTHARIGRVHVRIGLEPRYMILAMHLIRWGLQGTLVEALGGDPHRLFPAMRTIAKICDLELAIMLETYGDEYTTQIKRKERLAAIGQLGASISHEVKNPLGVIASSIYALKGHLAAHADEKTRRHLDRIERNVEQANQIVLTLLEFLRTREPVRSAREWNPLVREAAEGANLPPNVALDFALAEGVGRAWIDAVQVGRVIGNLVRNAAEAMQDGGKITIETAGDAEWVEVRVRDQGPGLPVNAIPQLFEPLFTTKAVGTGLGLALAKAIVEAHGGSISARNAEGGGAEMRVRLPRAEAAAAASTGPSASAATAAEDAGAGERAAP